jgi:hypothetical protein
LCRRSAGIRTLRLRRRWKLFFRRIGDTELGASAELDVNQLRNDSELDSNSGLDVHSKLDIGSGLDIHSKLIRR